MAQLLKKVFGVLTVDQKRYFIKLQIFTVCNMIIQPMSILLAIPFFSFASDLEAAKENIYFMQALNFLEVSELTLLSLMCIIIILGFMLSWTFNAWFDWILLKTIGRVNIELRKRLFDFYLYSPYETLQGSSSALISAQISNYVMDYLGILNNVIKVVSLLLTILGLSAILFYQHPVATLIFLILSAILFTFPIQILNKKISRWSYEKAVMVHRVYTLISNVFEGSKEIFIKQKEKKIQQKFQNVSSAGLMAKVKADFFVSLPKHVIVGVIYLILPVFIMIMLWLNEGGAGIISKLVVLGLVGLKIIPMIQQLNAHVTEILLCIPSFNLIQGPLMKAIAIQNSPIELSCFAKRELELRNISYRYPGSKKDTLKKTSFKFKIGNTIGIIGRSGSGKTTMIDVLVGLISFHDGSYLVDGKVLSHQEIQGVRCNFSFVTQNIFLMDDTIEKNISFFEEKVNKEKLDMAIEKSQLRDFINSLPNKENTVIGERGMKLSGGQRQRIGIARAIYSDKPILIFDEATSMLDVLTEEKIMQSVQSLAKTKTIIIVAHRLSTIKRCDKVVFFDEGTIVSEGTFDELCSNNEIVKRMEKLS